MQGKRCPILNKVPAGEDNESEDEEDSESDSSDEEEKDEEVEDEEDSEENDNDVVKWHCKYPECEGKLPVTQ